MNNSSTGTNTFNVPVFKTIGVKDSEHCQKYLTQAGSLIKIKHPLALLF